jgi:homospermidine synthase
VAHDQVKHAALSGRLVIVGFGSIGQGVLPLILRHIEIDPQRITIVTAEPKGAQEAADYGIKFVQQPLTRDNYRQVLAPLVGKGDFLLNLSVDVSSVALIQFARDVGALYLDTCIEPWPGGYTDPSLPQEARTNYALRASALVLKQKGAPTAVTTHGANPGLVSHLVKEAMLNVARDTGIDAAVPKDRAGWAALAQKLNVKVIHIAERDTQVASVPKGVGEFVNTWSIDGFVSEGCQPSELGWGSHEKHFPADGRRHAEGCKAGIFLMRPGASTRVRTWTPLEGPFHGFLITHNEAISIADYYTVGQGDTPAYRPTVHYAYHPCDDAVKSVHELAGKNWHQQATQRLLMDEITSGIDELGVLLAGHAKNAYWYGSQLTVEQARELVPYNNATSLQVTVAVLAGMVWAIEHPTEGVVEADEMDHVRCMEIMRPYLGKVVGVYSDWTPLVDRERMFPEDIDRTDPWQFKNVRVT